MIARGEDHEEHGERQHQCRRPTPVLFGVPAMGYDRHENLTPVIDAIVIGIRGACNQLRPAPAIGRQISETPAATSGMKMSAAAACLLDERIA